MNPISLKRFATLHVKADKPLAIGETKQGLRRIVSILGGTFFAPDINGGLKGEILPAGADYQLIQDEDGFSTLDARYSVALEDGARLYIVNRGMRHGPVEIMRRLAAGESVPHDDIYFRTAMQIETDAPQHAWMNRRLFLCAGNRLPETVELDVYEVQ